MLGIVSLPSSIVEPLIAFSIAYVAVENLFTTELSPWRGALVFLFGLLHGLGFAGVLGELGMPRGQFGLALVSFNVGVELGQLSVIALATLAVGWWRLSKLERYRRWVVVPVSLAIALVGLYWTADPRPRLSVLASVRVPERLPETCRGHSEHAPERRCRISVLRTV